MTSNPPDFSALRRQPPPAALALRALPASVLGRPFDACAVGRAAIDQLVDLLGGAGYDTERALRECTGTTPEQRAALAPEVRLFGCRSHAVQTAMLAESAGADEATVVGALLHDIGHAFDAHPKAPGAPPDDMHEIVGSQWLRTVFVDEVCDPVLLHVQAKRYLVATRPAYRRRLSPGSIKSLQAQGGALEDTAIAAFESTPGFRDGVRIRIWDDAAKVRGKAITDIEHYVPMMEAVLRR